MTSVSVIGLGGMGSALAQQLISAGHAVTVWNRTETRAEPLVQAGAMLAPSAGDAINASPVIVSCINTHVDTEALYSDYRDFLAGKDFIELSTGSADEAIALESLVRSEGGRFVVGAICAYPSGIGKEGTCIQIAGDEAVWQSHEAMLRVLGPASDFVSDQVGALAALFAGLFLARQGFMFGLIYGALTAERAGISAEAFFGQVGTTLRQAGEYARVAQETICSGDYTNQGAPLNVYEAAIKDMVNTMRQLGVPTDLPDLIYRNVVDGIEAGQGDEELPSLIKLFRQQVEEG